MKKKLPLLFILALLVNIVSGQITTPVVRANFGVDADVMSNYFNGAAQPAGDDWYGTKLAGTGQFVIDTTGAAAIVAGYTSNPASRMLSFSRLMNQAPYTTVNNRLLLDAVFHRDFHGNDSTVFAAGSNKNGMSPFNWTCPIAQGIPDKNDILDAFTHVRRAGPNVTDSMWMFSGIALENTSGSRYFDFELYQTDIYYDRPTQTFKNYGPDAGHTSWKFDAAGNIISVGDIVFTAEFGGSTLTLVEARIWVNKSALLVTPSTFIWGGQFDGDGAGAIYGYANIKPKTAGDFYTGLENAASGVWAGPFSLVRVDNSVVTTYIANQFMEFSVNLTKLGLDPGKTLNNPCGSPFRRVLIKTRSSPSFTAELKDFIAPFRMFDYAKVDADAVYTYFCGKMDTTAIKVYNPIPTSTYTWSTTNGRIVGSSVGTSILVDKPGTYYVTQQLNIQCSTFAIDSVKIIFDAVCMVLNVNILNLTAGKINKGAILNWDATNNNEAAGYEIEYSMDNRNFSKLASVAASGDADLAKYSFSYPFDVTNAAVIYYRIKIIGKNGKAKYSNTAILRVSTSGNPNARIFPNPTHGELWLSINSAVTESAKIYVLDATGKVVWTARINITKGESLIKMPSLTGKHQGIYLVKIKSANGDITQKIILLN